ncbi:MAG: hypothetical protein IT384_23300 [Deltaproteobacteria bacterium]|nr:hypothetical protein [Deltaproteobacteria bacterium]
MAEVAAADSDKMPAPVSVALGFLTRPPGGEPYALDPAAGQHVPAMLELERDLHGLEAMTRAVDELLAIAELLEREEASPTAAKALRECLTRTSDARALLERRAQEGPGALLERLGPHFQERVGARLGPRTAPQLDAPAPEGSVKLSGIAPLARRA